MSARRGAISCVALAWVAAACAAGGGTPRSAERGAGRAPADTMGAEPASVREIAVQAPRDLKESSAAARSATQPGVLFTINDSGHEPLLFALDTGGAARGIWRLRDADNDDWEAAAVGPCGTATDPGVPAPGPPRCVYVGDVGDNLGRHRTRVLYRVREPDARARGDSGEHALDAERLVFRYPDRRHNVEAMWVAANGTVHLLTKRPLRDEAGRLRPALLFTIEPQRWRGRDTAVAQLVDSVPIVPGTALGRQITDAALSLDGRAVAVRTYLQVYVFAADPRTGRIRTEVPPTVCSLLAVDEKQGEGIAWLDDDGRLLLTSEGRREPFRVISCPPPAA